MTESKPRWEVRLTRQAEKTLFRLSKTLLRQLDQTLLTLAQNPSPPESHQLAGFDNLYRLPLEEWRITYTIEAERLIVLILEIAPRQQPERYRLEEAVEGDSLIEGVKDDDPDTINQSETFFKVIETNFINYEPRKPDFARFVKRARHEKIRLLIVEDLPETRENLRKLLYLESDIEVVGAATNGEEAAQMAVRLQPDIVLMDILMPGLDSLTATEMISQQVPSAQVIMMSVHGEAEYLRRAMLAGAKEFLIKPFSRDELMTSIRRVYKLRQSTQPQNEAEADWDENQISAAALWFKFYKLGHNIEISLSVADLSWSLSFYQKLGFEKVDSGEKPYPWTVVSDGRLHLGLQQRMFASPRLSYFGLGIISERMTQLQKLGVRLDNIQKLEPIQGMYNSELLYGMKLITAEFESSEGQRVLLADLSSDIETTPSGRKFYAKYDSTTELSLPTQDINTALAYWTKLGFERVAQGDQPYSWAVVSDGLIRLGLHQTPKLTKPTITYFAPDMPERLKRMRRRGIQFVAEHKDKQGRRVGAVIESPDGQRFFFFSGEAKAQSNGPASGKEELEQEIDAAKNSPQPESVHWYMIYSYSGNELEVRRNLLHRVETMGLQHKIFQVVVPSDPSVILQISGCSFLSGSLLVEMIMDEDSWYVVKNTPGITGFVGAYNTPTPLPLAKVDKLLKPLNTDESGTNDSFKVGQKVRIIEGPFADFMGTVEGVDRDQARVKVQISFFGQEIPMEFDFLQVENV